jgi:hypothetical protein
MTSRHLYFDSKYVHISLRICVYTTKNLDTHRCIRANCVTKCYDICKPCDVHVHILLRNFEFEKNTVCVLCVCTCAYGYAYMPVQTPCASRRQNSPDLFAHHYGAVGFQIHKQWLSLGTRALDFDFVIDGKRCFESLADLCVHVCVHVSMYVI